LNVLGDLYLGMATGNTDASDLNYNATVGGAAAGNIYVRDGGMNITTANAAVLTITNGTMDVTGGYTGDVTVETGATLDLSATTGSVNYSDGRTLYVTGSFTNSGDGTNLDFTDNSTIVYNGGAGQVVLATITGNAYGNLTIGGTGNKQSGVAAGAYGGNVHADGDLTVDGGAAALNLVMNSGHTLYMQTAAATATYGSNGEEVVGAMRRTVAAATAGYTFNNVNTIVTFTAGGYDGWMEMNVQPATNPRQYVAATDVNRKITWDYDTQGWTATVRAGYKNGENPTYPTPDGANEIDLRFQETNNSSDERLAGSGGYNRNTADPVRFIELPGVEASATDIDGLVDRGFFASNDLVLRASRTVYAVQDGRWSNPNTWDDYEEPQADENVVIPQDITVHMGFRRNGVDGTTTDGQIQERVWQNPGQYLCQTIGIQAVSTGTVGGGLIVGYVSAGESGNIDEQSGNVIWPVNTSGSITNASVGTATPDLTRATGLLGQLVQEQLQPIIPV